MTQASRLLPPAMETFRRRRGLVLLPRSSDETLAVPATPADAKQTRVRRLLWRRLEQMVYGPATYHRTMLAAIGLSADFSVDALGCRRVVTGGKHGEVGPAIDDLADRVGRPASGLQACKVGAVALVEAPRARVLLDDV